jgi:phage gpG-like protein
MPVRVEMDVKISREAQNLIDQAGDLAPKAIKMGLDAVVTEAEGEVKKTITDIKLVDTGRLRSSIMGEISSDGKKGILGSDVKYAKIHEYGGDIKPKRAKALAFTIGDKFILTKKVTIKEKKFLRGTIDHMQSSGDVESLFSAGVRQAIERIEKGDL